MTCMTRVTWALKLPVAAASSASQRAPLLKLSSEPTTRLLCGAKRPSAAFSTRLYKALGLALRAQHCTRQHVVSELSLGEKRALVLVE
jgi:hypothetical protein